MERKNAWEGYSADQLEELDGLASRYIDYISSNKTERRCFAAAVKQAESAGYESLENVVREGRTLEAAAKYGLACMASRSFWLISAPSRSRRA